MFIEGPQPGQSADVIFDAGMPELKAKAMLKVAKRMNLKTEHSDNGNGTYEIMVYTGTPDTSTLFWRRTEDRMGKINKIRVSMESVLNYFRGEKSGN